MHKTECYIQYYLIYHFNTYNSLFFATIIITKYMVFGDSVDNIIVSKYIVIFLLQSQGLVTFSVVLQYIFQPLLFIFLYYLLF